MQKLFDKLTIEFRRHKGVLIQEQYEYILNNFNDIVEEDNQIMLFVLQASGYPIEYSDGVYKLSTYFTPYKHQKFCIIDIETNGSKPNNSQVIEVGAVMVQNGDIIDRFESFVECTYLPEYITKITGIEPIDLIDAPTQKVVLTKLKEFMQDSVFVAHNVGFDYSFLNDSFKRFGLGEIGNQKMCTIDLAKRTFESQKYGLAYLIESLELDASSHHRAYSDALCAYQVMQKSFETLPSYVKTTDDLLQFATSSKKTRREKNTKPSPTQN
jgi:DNA polymerase-3 subunit epsilon